MSITQALFFILDDLRNAAEQYHLTFEPDPAMHNHCTLVNMIGNNSCGVHALMAGKTAENIEGLEILTYDALRMHIVHTISGSRSMKARIMARTAHLIPVPVREVANFGLLRTAACSD